VFGALALAGCVGERERPKSRTGEAEEARGREVAKKVAERSWSREGVRFPLESDVLNPSGSTYRYGETEGAAASIATSNTTDAIDSSRVDARHSA